MTDESFKTEFLNTHNTLRTKHGSPPLTLSSGLCASAQEWADHLVSIQTMKHSDTKNGENIYSAWSSGPMNLTGKEAVEVWYGEIKDYDWNSPGFGYKTGHFTQVVWKETTQVGVGMATDGKNVFVVGQYSPAGNMNMPGYFEKNVPPLAGEEADGTGKTSSGGSGNGNRKKISCLLL